MTLRSMVMGLCLLMIMSACSRNHHVAYVSNAKRGVPQEIVRQPQYTIATGDRLYINIVSTVPETSSYLLQAGKRKDEDESVNGYTVDKEGMVQILSLDTVAAAGKTLPEFERYLSKRLKEEEILTDALVSVNLLNFMVTVVGEVDTTRVVRAENNRLTLFEALASCGDITDGGRANKITILRQKGDSVQVGTVDITDKAFLTSDYYYLCQGDVVFVEPTENRKKQAYSSENWSAYFDSGAALVRAAYSMVFYYVVIPRLMER